MRILKTLVPIFIAAAIASCGSAAKDPITANHHPDSLTLKSWEKSLQLSISAVKTTDKQHKAKLALDGIANAEECIMKTPEEAACYYYHAINTGIYFGVHVIGYQDGLKTMISDCKKVIKLNDKFDHAGAYRILGKIYTDVPEMTMTKNGITKNLEKAISYLQKAVQIDANYPENHIYLADAYFESGKKEEAISSLANAVSLVPQWKNHHDYTMWKKMNKALSEKLK
ncbi:MAG: tetratricopeptide repeat protein [Deltaproteobacteria bacterium]|nr:tetratricopeptide repeat protein [Deltaproteobacteria bacterium]